MALSDGDFFDFICGRKRFSEKECYRVVRQVLLPVDLNPNTLSCPDPDPALCRGRSSAR